YDGEWHKFSFYMDFTLNHAYIWFDEENETLLNYTCRSLSLCTTSPTGAGSHFLLQGNFAAQNPNDVAFHAIDDLEIWDSLKSVSGVTPPTLDTATISSNGLVLTLVFDETVYQGSGYDDSDWDIDASVTGSNIGMTYVSGDGTDTHVYTIASEIQDGETVNIDFNGDTNSEEDGDGDDLEAIVSDAVINNSEQFELPELLSSTISANGSTLTLVYDVVTSQGVSYNDSDFDLDASVSGNNISIVYVSGNNTTTHIYTIVSTILENEIVNIDFNGDADSIENPIGGDLVTIVSDPVVNNSNYETDPPVFTGSGPTSALTCDVDPESKTLTATTDEAATVKYDTSDVAYDSMSYTFDTTGATSHSHVLSGLACDSSYTYYLRGMDGNGNKSGSSEVVTFSINAADPGDVQDFSGCEFNAVGYNQ
ncbi:unnamed protein product, partial [marine sediment metagenome]